MEFVKDTATRQTLDLLTVTQKLDRPILAPPNTPAERLRELRMALAATARDPAFLAEMKKKNLTVEPTGAEEMAKIYADAFASPPAVVEAVKEMLGAKLARAGMAWRDFAHRDVPALPAWPTSGAQECSSMARAPVSKTGGWGFETPSTPATAETTLQGPTMQRSLERTADTEDVVDAEL